MKLIKFLVIFGFNFSFYRFTFYLLSTRNSEALNNAFLGLINDLSNIGFPYEFSISSTMIAIILTIPTSIGINLYIKNLFREDLNELGRNLIRITSINAVFLFSILYMLRIFNVSRFVLLLNILIFPLIYLIIWGINLIIKESNANKSNLLIFGMIIVLVLVINLLLIQDEDIPIAQYSTTNNENLNEVDDIIENIYEQKCNTWVGSSNLVDCIFIDNQYSNQLSSAINNLKFFEENLYIIYKEGLITKYDLSSSTETEFLNVSDKIFFEEFFGGLYDIAFHPNEDYFLISYINETESFIERYDIINDEPVFSKVVFRLPEGNKQRNLLNISINYSKYFGDFLVSIGDSADNVHSLDTGSPIGKLFLLNEKSGLDKTIITKYEDNFKHEIVAYGLRNVWQFYEYEEFIFMTDVGKTNFEELNIINLNNTTTNLSFGWPMFEGVDQYSGYEKNIRVNLLDYFLFENDNYTSAEDYIRENSIKPSVYYYHRPYEGTEDESNFNFLRAASIGGGVISDPKSDYFQIYFFSDYLSNEIFGYDFNNDELTIYPLKEEAGYITSLRVDPSKKDTLILSNTSGELNFIELP